MFVLAFAEAGSVQLIPDFSVFVHMFIILIMIYILNRTFFRPINKIIDVREKNKGGKFSKAEGILKEVSAKEDEYKKGLLEARTKSYEMIEKERSAALELKQNRLAEAKQEVAALLETELNELEQQTSSAKSAIAEEAEKMAEKISSNLLKTA